MSQLKSNKVFIAGQGAISSFCAANLQQNNIAVSQIVKEGRAKQAIYVDGLGYDAQLPTPCYLSDLDQIDVLFVPLKAYDIEPFIQQVLTKLSHGAHVILSHNGMGTIEPIKAILPPHVHLYFCTTNNGAFKHAQGVTVAGIGQTYWSELSTSPEQSTGFTNDDFESFFPTAERKVNLLAVLWHKLLINCVINPLTAIYRVKNGELANTQYQELIEKIVTEFLLIANQRELDLTFQQALEKVQLVIKQTAANTSSMLQDVTQERKTEVDFILGYVIKTAAEESLQLPVLEDLYQKVQALSEHQ